MSAQDEILRGFPNGINALGKNWRALLESIASVDDFLRDQAIELKKDSVVYTATGVNLDVLGSNVAVTRPPVGIADDAFRNLIALLSYNSKQIKPILYKLLEVYYGHQYVKTNVESTIGQPYDMDPNDDLILQIDEDPSKIITVTFNDTQFLDINAATSDEVAAVISQAIKPYGGVAEAFDDLIHSTRRIRILTNTLGPSGHVRIIGGQAQRKFQFPLKRAIAADNTTQFAFSTISGIRRRLTWTGTGTNPLFSLALPGDSLIIKDPAFSAGNQGTFTIQVSTAEYVEFDNSFGFDQTVTLTDSNNLMIFNPLRYDINMVPNYATIYQTNPQTLTVIMPAIMPIVKKSLKGSHHFHANTTILIPQWPGSFLYDTTQPLQIAPTNTFTTEDLAAGNIDTILNIENSADFPEQGYIVLNWGQDSQEGPIEFLGKASATQLIIDPSYSYKKDHNSGASVFLLESITGPIIDQYGNQYPVYITSTAPARLDLQTKVKQVVAAGVVIEFIIQYPKDPLYANLVFWHDKSDVTEEENNPVPVYIPPLPW